MLVRYYDAHRATTYDEWKPWFDGLDIYENPTPSKPHFSIDEIEVLLTHVPHRAHQLAVHHVCRHLRYTYATVFTDLASNDVIGDNAMTTPTSPTPHRGGVR